MPSGLKYRGASQKVLEYLRQHPDITIPYIEIENELHYPAYAVSNAITYLINHVPGADVERPIKGMVIYHSGRVISAEQETHRPTNLFEYLGKIDDNRTVIRDEEQKLFVAIPILEYLRSQEKGNGV